MKTKIDLEEVELALGNAEKFLLCFSEFCNREVYCPKQAENQSSFAFTLMNRFPQFEPLLNHAIDIIHHQRKVIEQTYTLNGGDAA